MNKFQKRKPFHIGTKEMSANNSRRFIEIFIEFPVFCLNILQEPFREPCNQKEIAAVIF